MNYDDLAERAALLVMKCTSSDLSAFDASVLA